MGRAMPRPAPCSACRSPTSCRRRAPTRSSRWRSVPARGIAPASRSARPSRRAHAKRKGIAPKERAVFRQTAVRIRALVLLGVLASLLAVACGLAPRAAQQPLKVRIGYQKTTTAPFVFIAKAQGGFEKAGVEVEWIDLPPQWVMEAIAAGSIDTGLLPGPSFLTGYEKGVDARLVLHLAGWSDPASTFFAR